MDATAKFVTIVAVAAFVTERIVATLDYLINAVRLSRSQSGIVVRMRRRERRKLVMFGIAALIAFAVVDRANLRLLRVLQIDKVHALVDFWLTWLVVVAGADRVRSMLGGGSAPQKPAEAPVVRLQVDGGEVRTLQRVS